jgi:signal transduction histidine kinase
MARPTYFYRLMQILALIHVGLFIWLAVDYALHPLEIGLSRSNSTPLDRALNILLISPLTIGVSILVLRRSKGNVVGLLLLIWGIAISTGSLRYSVDLSLFMAMIALNPIRFLSLIWLVFYFPDGSAYPRWLNRLAAPYMLLGVTMGLLSVLGAPEFQFDPVMGRPSAANPIFIPALQAPAEALFSFAPFLVLPLLPMLLIAPILRFRAADYRVRQQMKWLLFGAVIPFAQLLIFLSVTLGFSSDAPETHLTQIARLIYGLYLSLFPVFIVGNAILRHRLYDIDIIINRTLVYSVLTIVLIAIYAATIGGLTVFLGSAFEVSLLGAGIIAVLFEPLRERLQRAANRLMFGQRDEPIAVIDQLGKGLEVTASPESALAHLAQTTAETLKLPYVAVEYAETIVASGAKRGDSTRFPLIHQAQIIGHLDVTPRSPNESLNPADRLVLENVARQASSLVHAARLTTDLQESRQRIVTAREEERRRLRRDLHDGLGPALATLTLQAEAAHDLAATNPEKTQSLLGEIISGTQSALAEIRRVVYALRPPALDDLGLIPSINVQAAQYTSDKLSVIVEAPEVTPPLPAAVEVAVYRIVQEALTNVVRHAAASTCTLRLKIHDTLDSHDMIQLDIHDNGQGIAENRRAGVGLNAMHERAAELGGTCSIQSVPGQGTHISVMLPVEDYR